MYKEGDLKEGVLVRPGISVFSRSDERGYGGDYKKGLASIGEAMYLILPIQKVQVEYLCKHGMGVWR